MAKASFLTAMVRKIACTTGGHFLMASWQLGGLCLSEIIGSASRPGPSPRAPKLRSLIQCPLPLAPTQGPHPRPFTQGLHPVLYPGLPLRVPTQSPLSRTPHPVRPTQGLCPGTPPRALWSKDPDPLLPPFPLPCILLVIFFFFFIYDFQPSRLLACCVWKW